MGRSRKGTASDRASLAGERLTLSDGARGGKNELVKKLQRAQEKLSEVGQDERPDGLAETAEDVAADDLVRHRDSDVRLVTACCLVDVLRIYAPEPPYSPKELTEVFTLLIGQLQSLSTAIDPEESRAERVFYVLNSLAQVKSCVILTELAHQGMEGGEELLVDFFDALLTGVRAEHPQQVLDNILDALSVCLDELEVTTQPLMDVILMGLLKTTREENPKSYQLTQLLLRRCFNRVCNPISMFLNGVLEGSNRGIGGVESDLSGHIFSLIYELHKVNANMLLHVLPTVAGQLESEDLDTRNKAAVLLGRLFASPHAEFGVEYDKNWINFIGRFKDKDLYMRLKMVEMGAAIMQRKEALRNDLRREMGLRLTDPAAEVRRQAVHELCDVACSVPEAVTGKLLRDVSERFKDKKAQIRKDAATGLARVYAKHVSKKWGDETAANEVPVLSGELKEKLGWIPNMVIKCYAYMDIDMKTRVLQLLDDILLPRGEAVRVRAAGLVSIWSTLDSQAKEGFRRILVDKRKCLQEVNKYLDAREELRADPSDDQLEAKVKDRLNAILDVAPTADKKLKLLFKLDDQKDQKVFKTLRAVCDFTSTTDKIETARSELTKKVGSQTGLGEYIKTLTRRCACVSFAQDALNHTLAIAKAAIEEHHPSQYIPALGLLEVQCSVFPSQLGMKGQLSKVLPLLKAASGDHQVEARVMGLLAHCPQGSGHLPQAYRSLLSGYCLEEGTPAQAEASVQVLGALVGTDDALLAEILTELASSKRLNTKNPRIAAVLRCLASFAELFPALFSDLASHRAREFVMNGIQSGSLAKGAKGKSPKKSPKKGKKPQAQILKEEASSPRARLAAGLMLLTSRLVPPALQKNGTAIDQEETTEEAGELLDILFGIMESDGQPPKGSLDEEDATQLYAIAASCALQLMKIKAAAALLSPERWHALAWSLLHEEEVVRNENTLTLRFAAYLCLFGGEGMALQKEGQRALVLAFKTMVAKATAAGREKVEGSGAEPKLLTAVTPAYIVPYMIHLLAHHPKIKDIFKKSSSGSGNGTKVQATKQLQSYLGFALTPLIGTCPDAVDFVLQILSTMNSYQDRLDPESQAMHQVAAVAAKVLKQRIKTQDNLQPYPGTIFLPKPLYKEKPLQDADAAAGGLFEVASPVKTSKKAQPSHRSPSLGALASPIRRVGPRSGRLKRKTLDTPEWQSDGEEETGRRRRRPTGGDAGATPVSSNSAAKSSAKKSSANKARKASAAETEATGDASGVWSDLSETDMAESKPTSASKLTASAAKKKGKTRGRSSSSRRSSPPSIDDEDEEEVPAPPVQKQKQAGKGRKGAAPAKKGKARAPAPARKRSQAQPEPDESEPGDESERVVGVQRKTPAKKTPAKKGAKRKGRGAAAEAEAEDSGQLAAKGRESRDSRAAKRGRTAALQAENESSQSSPQAGAVDVEVEAAPRGRKRGRSDVAKAGAGSDEEEPTAKAKGKRGKGKTPARKRAGQGAHVEAEVEAVKQRRGRSRSRSSSQAMMSRSQSSGRRSSKGESDASGSSEDEDDAILAARRAVMR